MVHTYHDRTKHAFNRFARSVGYLDWATQPNPFRSFVGAPVFLLPRTAGSSPLPACEYDALFESGRPGTQVPLSLAAVGDLLRYALGLSAWKEFQQSRWALRVNPSSGNLHPTEAYLIAGRIEGLADTAGVYHYASDRHALEQRAAFDERLWDAAAGAGVCLVALTSIHWRESWKYGERAFRYCQHDLGHAIAAVRLAAALLGWTATLVPDWPQRAIRALVGADREEFEEVEPEEPECVLLIGTESDQSSHSIDAERLLDAVTRGTWFGRPNQLSPRRVQWEVIDEIARGTEDPGRPAHDASPRISMSSARHGRGRSRPARDARAIILQRRSALAFDGRSSIARPAFLAMLARTLPADHAPWDALWWQPCIHFALFVHRVDDLDPGLYVFTRDPRVRDRVRGAFNRDFLWEAADEELPLQCLARGDARSIAQRLSCDQGIASDGFFSLGMIADFDRSLAEHGPSFYRHLFWESGVVGQVLYLEAEGAGARATGIGCFYDDPVHDTLGITGHEFQSLYHFTVGMPVEDTRLTTEPGYEWERSARA